MQKNNLLTAVKGMNDILPSESYIWLWLEDTLRAWLKSYGYDNIRTPIVEHTSLFVHAIGEVTDVVEKEMYHFKDSLNNDDLALRPEGTAGTLRAVIEHNLLYNSTQKLWYMGQMFRHERPQKGRYRQFHQLGIEALGFADPQIDAEIILMQHDLWQRLGLSNLQLQINCLGDKEERLLHRKKLIDYFEQNLEVLDTDARARMYSNPLRILDSKNPALQGLLVSAPKLIDCLGDKSLAHHNKWKELLSELNIDFVENPRLVRGLDYYNLSVFEWISSNLGAQATIAGGGRYDPLVATLSGKENYAIGAAIGLERLILELEAVGKLPIKSAPNIFIANVGTGTDIFSFKVADVLRKAGYHVVQNMGSDSFKTQLKKASSLACTYTIIIGENELAGMQVTVKVMDTGTQEVVHFDNLLNYLQAATIDNTRSISSLD